LPNVCFGDVATTDEAIDRLHDRGVADRRVRKNDLSISSDHVCRRDGQERRSAMGIFVTFSADELEEFEAWRRANAKDGGVIVIKAVSQRRPDSFKVWFEKPVADHKSLPWYKPVQEDKDAADEA
jgi:hypothetical protein